MPVGGPAEPERYGEQYFGADNGTEYERLAALADVFDPVSRRHLLAAGVRPGWRCLEIGPGLGTIARWLADTVGPDGSVTAVDRDARWVREQPHPGLEVREADLTADGTWPADLAPGAFDLVHARMTVVHQRDRVEFIGRLAQLLRPGGALVLSDTAELGARSSAHPAYAAAMGGLCRFMADSIGSDTDWGRRYPEPLAACGLTGISLAVEAPVVEPGGPLARFWDLSFRQTAPRIVAGGYAKADDLDETLRYLADPDTRELSFVLCTATGRRPQ